MTIRTCTRQIGDRWALDVSHAPCAAPSRSGSSDLEIVENAGSEPNTLTRVAVWIGAEERVLRVHWCSDGFSFATFSALAVERTDRLFLGCGAFFCVVDVAAWSLAAEHPVMVFWSFDFRRGFVIARSEVECFLLRPAGVLLATVPVDPPWEEAETDEGMVFVSLVNGRQVLRWPAASAAF